MFYIIFYYTIFSTTFRGDIFDFDNLYSHFITNPIAPILNKFFFNVISVTNIINNHQYLNGVKVILHYLKPYYSFRIFKCIRNIPKIDFPIFG